MKANTHLEVPPVNWAIIHTTLAGSSLLPLSQNQQQQAVGVLRPGQGACGEVGPQRAGGAWAWLPWAVGWVGALRGAGGGGGPQLGGGAAGEPRSTCVGFY